MGAVAACHVDHGVVWDTPRAFYEGVARRFGPFDLDAAATQENALAPRYWTPKDDALQQPWTGRVWCNPPYGRGLNEPWAEKAVREVRAGRASVVAYLQASATETRWWNLLAENAAEVHFVTPRLRFGGADSGGTFASTLFVLRPGEHGPPRFGRMNAVGDNLGWQPKEPSEGSP